MARFDVHPNPDSPGYLLDCQADLLAILDTRLVVPLLPLGIAVGTTMPRLNPTFVIDGEQHIMLTQAAASVPKTILGRAVTSLADQDFIVSNALDMLLTGI